MFVEVGDGAFSSIQRGDEAIGDLQREKRMLAAPEKKGK